MFELADDGTLDIVVECSRCGAILRYYSELLVDDSEFDLTDVNDIEELDELRVSRAIEDAEDSHECEESR